MPIEPQRKEQPRRFLDASLVPLERALRDRATAIREEARLSFETSATAQIGFTIAKEFDALADELHYW